MSALRRWRPGLRLAWRDSLRNPLRTVVLTVLVALPIAVAVVASAVSSTHDYYSANSLYPEMGSADARIEVTRWPEVRVANIERGRWTSWRKARGLDPAQRRDPATVDVDALLPPDSRTSPIGSTHVDLAVGGGISALVADLADPLTRGLARLEGGRAPREPDEVAVSRLMADELGLLDKGELAEDAVLETAGQDLRVVGLVEIPDDYGSGWSIVLPPATVAGPVAGAEHLVDLPELSTSQARDLQRALAGAGISARMRAAAENPEAWVTDASASSARPDAIGVAVGALVVGLGLIEVLVLVGSAFAVGARRQSRALGLVMASGGAPADVRRIVLAQGVWIGLAATALGLAGGTGCLVLGRDLIGRLGGTTIYEYSVSVGAVVAVAVLGFVSAVLAAALPAWGAGRLTATQALDGHIAAGARRTRGARLRAPALALTGAGAAGLCASGLWIARAYADQPDHASPLPVVAGGLSALLLMAGVGLLTPFLVDSFATAASRGWLPWRLASRDAGRHPARTTAAVFGIGIVVTGAVLAGFGVSANAALNGTYERTLPPGTASLELAPREARDPAAMARITEAVRDVTGATGIAMYGEARFQRESVLDFRHSGSVVVVDQTYLEVAGAPSAAREAFASGTALVIERDTAPSGALPSMRPPGDLIRDGQVAVVAGPRRDPLFESEIPALGLRLDFHAPGTVLISATTATSLGLSVGSHGAGVIYGDEPISASDAERLRLYGIYASAEEPDIALDQRLLLAGAGAVLLVTCLVVGMIVALASSESRGDAATLSAVGAPPWIRRAMSAGHALFVGCLGAVLGVAVGTPIGLSVSQVVGTPGSPGPWSALLVLVVGAPLFSAAAGWLVTPARLPGGRRTG